MTSQSGITPSGPFAPRAASATSKAKAVIASNLPFGSGGFDASSSQAHPPHVSPLSRPGTGPGIRPVIREPTGWKDRRQTAPAFLLPFGHRHSLLGRPVPATEFRLP